MRADGQKRASPISAVASAFFLIVSGWAPSAAAQTPAIGSVLAQVADVPLPGAATRFDYQSYDPTRHWLFIAHLGDSSVVVFDTRLREVVKVIVGIDHVHGVLAVPALGRVFATATGSNELVVIDEATLTVVARVPAGVYPDGLAYVPTRDALYISDETGASEAVVDVRTNRLAAVIPLDGEAGNTRYDAVSGHVFVNDQTHDAMIEIDPAREAIVQRHPLPGCRQNHGLLLDPTRHIAYIACAGNDRLLVFDLDRMRVVQSHGVGRDPDVLDLDDRLGILYVASEGAVVSVFKKQGDGLASVGDIRLADAHTIAVDPQTHQIYLPLRRIHGRPVLRIMSPQLAP